MKNLNRKLSVIALSGMALFGGVAASGVQAFANDNASVSISEENKDRVWLELQKACREYDYRVSKEFKNKAEAKEALNKIRKEEPKRKVYGGIRSLKESSLRKILFRLWSQNFERVVVEYKGKFFLIQLDYRLD